MASQTLNGMVVAILVTDDLEQEVVVDQGLVTSRKPADIPAFNREVISLFAGGRGQSQQAAAE